MDKLLTLPKPRYEAELPLDMIDLNPYQPRDPIGEEDVEGMKSYIQSGILEPVIVHQKGDKFELVAGERRLRAAKALGMSTIPAMIYLELTPGQVKLMSLQENLGRKDLDWLEIARGYQALVEEGLAQEQIAGLVGADKTTVSRRLALLGLPEEVKKLRRRNFLEGHAAVLLQLETPEEQLEAFREWQKAPVTVKSFRAGMGVECGNGGRIFDLDK